MAALSVEHLKVLLVEHLKVLISRACLRILNSRACLRILMVEPMAALLVERAYAPCRSSYFREGGRSPSLEGC